MSPYLPDREPNVPVFQDGQTPPRDSKAHGQSCTMLPGSLKAGTRKGKLTLDGAYLHNRRIPAENCTIQSEARATDHDGIPTGRQERAMAVEFDKRDGVLHLNIFGTLTDLDLHAIAEWTEQAERETPTVPSRIVDMTQVERMEVGFQEIWSLAHRRMDVSLANAVRTAIVTQTPVQRGMARMFQTLNSHPQISIQLFEGIDAAERWLRDP